MSNIEQRRKEIEAQIEALKNELESFPKWDGAKVGDRVRVTYEFTLSNLDTDSAPFESKESGYWHAVNDMTSFEIIERA